MEDFKKLKREYYGKNICVLVGQGVICFDPNSMKAVVGAESITYDAYLDIQIRSLGKCRLNFEVCYFNFPMKFKGQIEKFVNKHVCFKRIFVSGMFPDGEIFKGKEDHVWMEQAGFEAFRIGDCLSFSAEVYRYIKTGNGKLIDYSLRNPLDVRKIVAYTLPSDEELAKQTVNQIFCEVCFLRDQCNKVYCMRNFKNMAAILE